MTTKPASILVAEDEAITARDIQSSLTHYGYEVPLVVSTGLDAVRKALEMQPDLVLMDIRLDGEMNGIDAAEAIRKTRPIPVVFMTGLKESQMIHRARKAHPHDVLTKPIIMSTLLSTVDSALLRAVPKSNIDPSIPMMEVNQLYTHEFQYSQAEVNRFAEVTGDTNPLHIQSDYAARSVFKKPIMHGMLSASLFSKVFGTRFPGEGTVYLDQTLHFLKPMYVDTPYEAVFTVKKISFTKKTAVVETLIKDKEGTVCTIGEATVMNRDRIRK